MNKDQVSEKDRVLNKMLEPIVWDWSSSITARQNLVSYRHRQVRLVLPFLYGEDLDRAKKWLEEERHSDLWD